VRAQRSKSHPPLFIFNLRPANRFRLILIHLKFGLREKHARLPYKLTGDNADRLAKQAFRKEYHISLNSTKKI
jgi:hypothetical protein